MAIARVRKTWRRQVIYHIHLFELLFGLAHARTIEENGFALCMLEIFMGVIERVLGEPCAIAEAREREEAVLAASYIHA